MNRFIKWLTTVPEEEELFFMRVRRDASSIFTLMHDNGWRGHQWDHPRGKDAGIRRCLKCGLEQWKFVKRIPETSVAEWRTIHPEKELP